MQLKSCLITGGVCDHSRCDLGDLCSFLHTPDHWGGGDHSRRGLGDLCSFLHTRYNILQYIQDHLIICGGWLQLLCININGTIEFRPSVE